MNISLRKNEAFWIPGLAVIIFGMIVTIVFAHAFTSQDMSTMEPASNQVFFYEHENYGGQTMSFSPDMNVGDLTKWKVGSTKNNWNDRISSIKVGSQVKVTAWKDTGFKGAHVDYTTGSDGQGHYASLGVYNDWISSFQVRSR
jgi:hypothetical protein